MIKNLNKKELKKRAEANKIKNHLLKQIKEKEIYNYEAKKEYERDFQNVKELMENLKKKKYINIMNK